MSDVVPKPPPGSFIPKKEEEPTQKPLIPNTPLPTLPPGAVMKPEPVPTQPEESEQTIVPEESRGFDMKYYKLPTEAKRMMGYVEKFNQVNELIGKDPTEEMAKVNAAGYLSEITDMSSETLYNQHEGVKTAWVGTEGVSNQKWWEYLRDCLDAGVISNQLADLGYEYSFGSLFGDARSEETLAKINDLRSRLPSVQRAGEILPAGLVTAAPTAAFLLLSPVMQKQLTQEQRKTGLLKTLGNVAYMIPQLLDIGGKSILGGMGGGLTAVAATAAVGAAIPLPEEALTLPISFWVGFVPGAKTVASVVSGKKMMGAMYLELMDLTDPNTGEKIDNRLAFVGSLLAAIPAAFVETVQFGQIAKTIPGIKKIFSNSLNRATKDFMLKGGLGRILFKHLVQVGKHGVWETAEEMTQEGLGSLMQAIVVDLNNKFKGTEFESQWSEIVPDIIQQAELFGAMTLTGVGGHVWGVGQDFIDAKVAKKQFEDFMAQEEDTPETPDKTVSTEDLPWEEYFDTKVDYDQETYANQEELMTEKLRDEQIDAELAELDYQLTDAEKEARVGDVLGAMTEKAYKLGFKKGQNVKAIHRDIIKLKQKGRKAKRLYVLKLARKIVRPPGSSIDFFYREAIENLQSGIDPHFRQDRTIETRKQTQEFLDKYPERTKDMPTKLLNKLNQKPLNDWTIAELEELTGTINYLRKMGKLKRQLTIDREARQHTADVDQILENLTTEKTIGEDGRPRVQSPAKQPIIPKVVQQVGAISLRPQRIMERLDGGVQGRMYQRFWTDVNKATDAELTNIDNRMDPFMDKVKELGFRLSDFTKTREVDGEKYAPDGERYTLDKLLDIYAGSKNISKRLALIYGNDISEATMTKIIDSLSDNEKALADYIIEEYESNYDRLRDFHIQYANEDLGHEDNYTPIRRAELNGEPLEAQLKDDLLQRHHLYKSYAEHGFTKKRLVVPEEYQKKHLLGLVEGWMDMVQLQERYITHGLLQKQLQRIATDPKVVKGIEQRYGKPYVDALQHYTDQIVQRDIFKGQSGVVNNVLRTVRKNRAVAYLAGNVNTMFKQLPSLALYVPYSGPVHMYNALGEFTDDPFAAIDFVNSKDPQMKHRSIEREINEFKQKDKALYQKIVNKVGEAGMVGIVMFDKIATTVGWKAVYNKALADGMSDAEAVRLAQDTTLRTQPASRTKDLPELYRTHEVLNYALQFTNQINQLWNVLTHDMPTMMKQRDFGKLALSLASTTLMSMFIWAAGHRRLPESEEDIKEAISEDYINRIPLVGRYINSAREGWHADAPGFGIVEAFTEITKKGEPLVRKIPETAEELAPLFGYPVTMHKRIYKFLDSGDIRELFGGPPRE